VYLFFFFFSSRRRHTRCLSDWSSDVCSSDLALVKPMFELHAPAPPPNPERAVQLACDAIARTWTPRACMRSPAAAVEFFVWATRSEERRVGKECRWRWWEDV